MPVVDFVLGIVRSIFQAAFDIIGLFWRPTGDQVRRMFSRAEQFTDLNIWQQGLMIVGILIIGYLIWMVGMRLVNLALTLFNALMNFLSVTLNAILDFLRSFGNEFILIAALFAGLWVTSWVFNNYPNPGFITPPPTKSKTR